jgi:nitronate monooxygenase
VEWRDTELTRLLGIELPVVLAPLAGGPSTPALAAAVSAAGGLGSLGVAYLSPDQVRAEVRRVRELTDRPFAVGLLVPGSPSVDGDAVSAMWQRLAPYRHELGLPDAEPPTRFAENLAEQEDVLLDERVPVVTYAFGLPDLGVLRAFQRQGTRVVATVATAEEALTAERAGVDVLCAQGLEAGGHRGGLAVDAERAAVGMGLMALLPAVRRVSALPVLAAGGIMDGRGVAAALALGAAGVQMGTAFLRTAEAGTSAPYREALVRPGMGPGLITGISGRPAGGLWNRLAAELAAGPVPPLPYPVMNALTRDIRRRAAELGRAEFLSLWAGQGVGAIRDLPAGELVARLVAETDEAVAALGSSRA